MRRRPHHPCARHALASSGRHREGPNHRGALRGAPRATFASGPRARPGAKVQHLDPPATRHRSGPQRMQCQSKLASARHFRTRQAHLNVCCKLQQRRSSRNRTVRARRQPMPANRTCTALSRLRGGLPLLFRRRGTRPSLLRLLFAACSIVAQCAAVPARNLAPLSS